MRSREVIETGGKSAVSAALAVLTALVGSVVLTALLQGTLGSAAAQPAGAPADPSWTATSRTADVVAGRKALMQEAGLLMTRVDTFAAADGGQNGAGAPTADDLHRAAESIERLLRAFPHLFPPPTNLYDANDELAATAALPAIWQRFSQFYAANEAAIGAARALAEATGTAELRAAALALRGSCDDCHADFVASYTPPVITDADRDIDFDSLFQ